MDDLLAVSEPVEAADTVPAVTNEFIDEDDHVDDEEEEEEEEEEETLEEEPVPVQEGPVVVKEDKLIEWRREHYAALQEQAQAEMVSHGQKIEEAKKDIEQYYEERKVRIEKKAKSNREAEAALLESQGHGAGKSEKVWDQVVGMVNLAGQGDGTDVTRMRQLLLAAKHDEEEV